MTPPVPTSPIDSAAGILAVDKPVGPTSRAVLDRIGRLLPRGTRFGHAGTLDPAASGLLIVCLGSATRLIRLLHAAGKSYQATVRLGATSNTLDADGIISETPDATAPTLETIQAALVPLTGRVRQIPPAFSALKVGGQRAYDLARRGVSFELQAREVQIDRIAVLSYAWPLLELEIDCGSGTYIRSIARDLGEAVATGGLLQSLRRTRVGRLTLADAVPLDELTPESLPSQIRPARDAVAHLGQIALKPAQLALIRHGRPLDTRRVAGLDPAWDGAEIALLDPAGGLAAIGRVELASSRLAPTCVLPLSASGDLK
ncbi:MAG: tRNA pseudouridine synthase B [Isosphaeraceae bacterium]|jgi:tRNA pseudouridine55 synthase|nr:MAG: tRNA pseudouridine synthase B [Isosphaeraceae bacterium]